LKAWLITNKKDLVAQEMFYNAIDALESKLLKYVRNGELLMVLDSRNGRMNNEMQHLACFSGGMYALASIHATNGKSQHYMDIAKLITKTCHRSYNTTASGLGSETFRMDNNGKISSRSNSKMYILRPETVESYFYLWRLTHDPMYREWGWEAVKALESHCKVPSGGYTGIKDVYSSSSSKDDVQQSFFIAETLKYLYLLFSDDTDIPLDKWIFNTEAHPLPLLSTFPDSQHLNRTMVL
jgi:mannosyl-oligosaccharide alpha-1,2-mannosidase